ncbi:hypothetical protein [Natrialba taiwanensis]|uniref:hypothetical protein n=1 Tax=Natrialba taiwanensis TaxID=160846 RepID=UPI000677CCB6|nr:hypothetical protein [Natrialba taiwanensis]
MSDEYETYLKISGEASNHVEAFYHEIVKQSKDGQRFGVNIDVERVELQEDADGFSKANE